MSVHVEHGRWGLTWSVDEPMHRTSHALVSGGDVWLVDPVIDEQALAVVEKLGAVRGVLQLLDRHDRDGAALAARYGVEHLRLPDGVPGAPFELTHMVWVPRWREVALWWEAQRLLLISEAVGTIAYFAVHGGAVGVHPFLRAWPPGPLRELCARDPKVLLCGHGLPVTTGVGAALDEALDRSRRDIPKAGVALVKAFTPLG